MKIEKGYKAINVQLWVIIMVMVCSCIKKEHNESTYENKVKEELNSGIRNDSLFHGIYLGMSKKDFYTHCWDLNKKGMYVQGPNNLSVQYELKNELKADGYLYFYPTFYKEQIMEMPMTVSYAGWSPWAKHLSTDSLLIDAIQMMERWYGEGFMEISDPEKGKAMVKVDGNRRIGIYKKKENTIGILITDLIAKEKYLIEQSNSNNTEEENSNP